jgi:hypothetical protein
MEPKASDGIRSDQTKKTRTVETREECTAEREARVIYCSLLPQSCHHAGSMEEPSTKVNIKCVARASAVTQRGWIGHDAAR